MILFAILLLIIILLVVVVVFAASLIGAGAILIFGDVIVCIALIAFLIKKIYFK